MYKYHQQGSSMNLTGHRINNDNNEKVYQPIIKNGNRIVLLNVASNKLIKSSKEMHCQFVC